MIGYASRTGTRKNLDMLRAEGWRLLISAAGVHRDEGFRYCLDNGAWTAHTQGKPFDVRSFEDLLWSHGAGADWIAAPDIVAGGLASLEMSWSWLDRLRSARMVLIPVQDGMTPEDVRPLLSRRVGIFLGGSTEWKLATMRAWGDVAERAGCYYHVARVNSQDRIQRCAFAGADSFDGSGVSKFSAAIPVLSKTLHMINTHTTKLTQYDYGLPCRRPATQLNLIEEQPHEKPSTTQRRT